MVFGPPLAWARTGTFCEDVPAQRRMRSLSMAPFSPQGITCVCTRPNGSARPTVVMEDTSVNGAVWPCLGDGCHGQHNVLRRILEYPTRTVRANVRAIPMPNTIGWHHVFRASCSFSRGASRVWPVRRDTRQGQRRAGKKSMQWLGNMQTCRSSLAWTRWIWGIRS